MANKADLGAGIRPVPVSASTAEPAGPGARIPAQTSTAPDARRHANASNTGQASNPAQALWKTRAVCRVLIQVA